MINLTGTDLASNSVFTNVQQRSLPVKATTTANSNKKVHRESMVIKPLQASGKTGPKVVDSHGSNALFESLKNSIGAFGARQSKLA